MNISFVLAVYNGLHMTQNCYMKLREVYPEAPMVISSGGSNDGTKEWLESLQDDFLSYIHDDEKITFSDNYNAGIKLVDTEKLVLIHNDMVIGEGFLEAIERLLEPDMVLSYTTIEPPIFTAHKRPGKVILDLGTGFSNFDPIQFDSYVQQWKNSDRLYDGAVFFMSGYKKMFEDVGMFDGFSFVPVFCEDDDFLLRAKLKGFKLKTCESAIVYHFVSQTIRFGNDYKDKRVKIEMDSNINFIRKWGVPMSSFNQMRYWEDEIFTYRTFKMGLTTKFKNLLQVYEPFFDKINLGGEIPEDFIELIQPTTRYDIRSKFTLTDDVDVMIYEKQPFSEEDYSLLNMLRFSLTEYEPGEYEAGNMKIEIRKKL
jgi:GT2 family glycosyltransferase